MGKERVALIHAGTKIKSLNVTRCSRSPNRKRRFVMDISNAQTFHESSIVKETRNYVTFKTYSNTLHDRRNHEVIRHYRFIRVRAKDIEWS